MTEPMVTEEDREIARRYTCSWKVEGRKICFMLPFCCCWRTFLAR